MAATDLGACKINNGKHGANDLEGPNVHFCAMSLWSVLKKIFYQEKLKYYLPLKRQQSIIYLYIS